MRSYWLSFADPDLPEGSQFRGVVVVDVDERDARVELDKRPDFPFGMESAYLAAAIRMCWAFGVNPGGEVQAARLDDAVTPESLAKLPRLRLMQKDDLEAFTLEPGMKRPDPPKAQEK